MELLYSVSRKPLKCEPPHLRCSDPEVWRPLCALSVRNVVALWTGAPLQAPGAGAEGYGVAGGGYVYVADLDTPWDAHLVTTTSEPVSALEWDCEGKQLVVGTADGEISVFGHKDYLLNQWTCLYTASLPCEPIVRCVFFHNGRRLVSVDKKADAAIAERVQQAPPAPTLRGLGGVAVEGCLAVSATGQLVAMTSPGGEGQRAHCAADQLRTTARRDRVRTADFAHNKDGSVSVAAVVVSASGACLVRVGLCVVRRAPGQGMGSSAGLVRPRLRVQAMPALLLAADAADARNHRVLPAAFSCVAWGRDDPDSLYVGGAGGQGGALSLWRLAERAQPLHKLLAKGGNTTPGGGHKTDCFTTLAWQRVGSWPLERCASWAACAGARGVLVAAADRLVLLPRAQQGQPNKMCSLPLISPEPPDPPSAKRPRRGPSNLLSSCAVSALGGAAVAVDWQGNLYAATLPQPWTWSDTAAVSGGGGFGPALQAAASVLEYGALAGIDCLDVLLTLQPQQLEVLHDRLVESFGRQPPAFQQYHHHSWLRLRAHILRRVPGVPACGLVSALWAQSALLAAWAAVGAALRPDERLADAQPLAALLQDDCKGAGAIHLDKVLMALESKAEPSGEWPGLQPLRRQLRRAVDTAATVIAAAAAPHPPHGQELWSDPSLVAVLRKLLALARADPALGRALARLAQAQGQPKQDLLEECALLALQHGARVWECPPILTAVSAPHQQRPPHKLEYLVEPVELRAWLEPPAHARSDHSAHMDTVSYMYLGAMCARWRQCARCGARARPATAPGAAVGAAGAAGAPPAAAGAAAAAPSQPAHAAVAALRAHTDRYLPYCRCGGKWTLVSNV